MAEPIIRFPVVCPQCRNEHLTEIPVSTVADALLRDAHISLTAACHNTRWDASTVEVKQIREYLGSVWLNAQH